MSVGSSLGVDFSAFFGKLGGLFFQSFFQHLYSSNRSEDGLATNNGRAFLFVGWFPVRLHRVDNTDEAAMRPCQTSDLADSRADDSGGDGYGDQLPERQRIEDVGSDTNRKS